MPSGVRLFTVTDFLFRRTWMNAGLLFHGRGPGSLFGWPPSQGGIIWHMTESIRAEAARVIGFQIVGFSTLMQSAPMSARYMVADWPAQTAEKSQMRMPSSGR